MSPKPQTLLNPEVVVLVFIVFLKAREMSYGVSESLLTATSITSIIITLFLRFQSFGISG